MTKNRVMEFFQKHPHQMIPITTPEQIDKVWHIMKSVRHPRYTKTRFLENIAKESFNCYISDESGRMIAVWMASGVVRDGQECAFIELTWHDGSAKGRLALAYLGISFMISLVPNTPVVYYSVKNPWKYGVPTGDGYYIFDTTKTMEEIWPATI
jgi:hypothetical protein